jgi:hypothetical protein
VYSSKRDRLTSGLNSVNSRPRQSNSNSLCCFGGSVTWYGTAAALIVAVDSRYKLKPSRERSEQPSRRRASVDHRVPCSSCTSTQSWPLLCCRSSHSSPTVTGISVLQTIRVFLYTWEMSTHESVDANMIGMGFPAGGTLDLEHVPERVVFGVVWSQIGDSCVGGKLAS